MAEKRRDPRGVWFQVELRGLNLELYGVPREPSGDDPGASAEEDARKSLFDYAGNGGRRLLGTLARATLEDIIALKPFDLRRVGDDRQVEIERAQNIGDYVDYPVVVGVGDCPESAFASFDERQVPEPIRMKWFDDALQSLQ